MGKSPEHYIPRMGYMPCYKFPEKMGEDEEFEFTSLEFLGSILGNI